MKEDVMQMNRDNTTLVGRHDDDGDLIMIKREMSDDENESQRN